MTKAIYKTGFTVPDGKSPSPPGWGHVVASTQAWWQEKQGAYFEL